MNARPGTNYTEVFLVRESQEIKQYSISKIILYHLLPGVPVLIVAIICANPFWGLGLPMFLSLMIAFALCLVPGQWLIMKIVARREGKRLRDVIGFAEKMSATKTILWALPGGVLAALVFTFGTEIERPLWTIFAWVPDWFWVNRSLLDLGDLLVPTIILNFIIRGFLVPYTEEIYFRGFLLPRMNRLGGFAPFANAALFSVNHLFAPWENVTRMLAVLPFVYTVWQKKNVYIGVIAHCAVNTLGCIAMLMPLL